jgi:Flp pilus assembly protein TadG
MRKIQSRKGNATVEFIITGIPLIFMIISVVEMARGMWIYNTLVYATETTTRDMAVRGYDCSTYVSNCSQTIGGYATLFHNWAIGLDPGQVNVTFQSETQTVNCNPLSSCYTTTTAWPPSGDSTRNLDIWVTATMPFDSALGMFVFGSKPVVFDVFTLSAKSHQQILF